MAKKTRRTRGADGKLHTKEELKEKKVSSDSSSSKETEKTKVVTEGGLSRSKKDSVQEKVPKTEQDNSPFLILSYHDVNGKRITKEFTCEKIDLTENTQKTLKRGGPQTVMDLYIEASVISVI